MSTAVLKKVHTKAYDDQKPGTSGLRKKVPIFQQENYIENFVQATFNALKSHSSFGGIPDVLAVGGDGRYLSEEACDIIIRMAAANGVRKVIVGQHTLMSTPAVSAVIRTHPSKPKGAFILTASHNPGGLHGDFGMKYNCANGGPAPEKLTDVIFTESTKITEYHTLEGSPKVNLGVLATTVVGPECDVEVIDSVALYANLMSTIFDFGALQRLIHREGFRMHFDAMYGVAGPYAKRILVDVLGANPADIHNAEPKLDFGGGHPDPNLTYAADLVRALGLKADGTVAADAPANVPAFGAACDGDADRNMVLGGKFFVTPSDSVAIIAAKANVIPYFSSRGGLKSVARSMPTSGALDRVADALKLPFFEVPTGWKFFGNLMDSKELYNKEEYTPFICGEESFGTGSSHVREKDGLWAVLAWLSILADANKHVAEGAPIEVSIQQIVEAHWATYGRNYYRRYDYEEVDTLGANNLMDAMRAMKPKDVPELPGGIAVKTVDDFEYKDVVDGSVSKKQGIRVIYDDGSRFIFRLSGTGSHGATVRLYLEQYMTPQRVREFLATGALPETGLVLEPLVDIAIRTAKIKQHTNRDVPTVIT